MEGSQSNRSVDTQGPFDKRAFRYDGVTDHECPGNQNTPALPSIWFVEEVKGFRMVLSEEWYSGDANHTRYTLFFDMQFISVSQSFGIAAGRRCKGGVQDTEGDMAITLSLRQRRVADKHILMVFSLAGTIWKDQEGGIGNFILNILNGTNNQLLHSEPILAPYRKVMLLTDIYSTDLVPDGHEFKVEIRHDCVHKTQSLGKYSMAGARFDSCLAIETARQEI